MEKYSKTKKVYQWTCPKCYARNTLTEHEYYTNRSGNGRFIVCACPYCKKILEEDTEW